MLAIPAPDEHIPQFARYIGLIGERKLEDYLTQSMDRLLTRVQQLTEEQALFRYEPGKWSIKQVLGHLADAERVMCYRILRIARGDNQTALVPFDENLFVASAHFDEQPVSSRTHELHVVRQSTLALCESIHDEAWLRRGMLRNHETSARAIAYFMAGHFEHHVQVLDERYLAKFN